MRTYVVGRTLPIRLGLEDWLDPDGNDLSVKIELTRDNGDTWETISETSDNYTTFNWTITGPPSVEEAFFRYSDPDAPSVYVDGSNFSISLTSITNVPIIISQLNKNLLMINGINIW